MANYEKLAQQIIKGVGGVENVASVTHCATRLWFHLKDESKADDKKVDKIHGVMGVVRNSGQYQVIIGNSVHDVYVAITSLEPSLSDGSGGGAAKAEDTKTEKRNLLSVVCETIAGLFTPILPAITAAGMLQAVLVLVSTFEWMDVNGSTYYVLSKVANAGFYFLPMMLAHTAAKKFNCNPYLAIMLAGVLLHPDLLKEVYAGKGLESPLTLFGIPIRDVTYASSVLPIILGVWLLSYGEKIGDKVSPKAVIFFLKPLIAMLITAPITLIVLGPLGMVCGEYLAQAISFLSESVGWLSVGVMGAASALLVMTGMHYAFFPIIIAGFASFGYDSLMVPSMLATNIAQGGAALAVARKTKNKDFKVVANSSGITAVLGITEPAMYGVNLRLKKPFIGVMIGGGLGGLFAGLMGLKAYAMASPGLAAAIIFLGGESLNNFFVSLATMLISFVGAFVATWFLGFEDIPEDKDDDEEETPAPKNTNHAELIVKSPLTGEVVPLENVNDPTFAQGMLGKGAAVLPSEGVLTSPVNGEVVTAFPTKHAYGLKADTGEEILIHIGLNTVELNGKHFETFVENGQKIKVGDKLAEFDIDAIKKAGYDLTTMVLISNTPDYSDIEPVAKDNQIKRTEDLISVK